MLEHVQRVREARRKPQSVVVSARSDGGKPAGVARLLGDARTLGRVAIIAVCDKGDPRRKLSGQLGSRDVLQAALAPQAAEAIGNALPLGERLDAESAEAAEKIGSREREQVQGLDQWEIGWEEQRIAVAFGHRPPRCAFI